MADDAGTFGRTHSRFGGSVADRYMNCAGSVALNAGIPNPESSYAREGTWAHYLGEYALRNGYFSAAIAAEECPSVDKATGQDHVWSVQDIDAVQVYLDEVYAEVSRFVGEGGEAGGLYVEQDFVLDLPSADPGEVHGSNDALVYHEATGRLRVFDYKHGVGVSVSAEENTQLKFYALGAICSHPEWRITEVILTIVQPRALDVDEAGAVKDFTFELVDLLEFQGDIDAAIRKAKHYERERNGLDVFNTGKWCRWCPAKGAGVCPAVLADAVKDFDGVIVRDHPIDAVSAAELPAPQTFDMATLSKLKTALQDVWIPWLNQVVEYHDKLVLEGTPSPGWKVVDGVARAEWIDDREQIVTYAEMVFDMDRSALMPPKIITITEMKRQLKAAGANKDQIDAFMLKFTIKESTGPTVVRASDRRPAIDGAADFKSVNLAAIAAE